MHIRKLFVFRFSEKQAGLFKKTDFGGMQVFSFLIADSELGVKSRDIDRVMKQIICWPGGGSKKAPVHEICRCQKASGSLYAHLGIEVSVFREEPYLGCEIVLLEDAVQVTRKLSLPVFQDKERHLL